MAEKKFEFPLPQVKDRPSFLSTELLKYAAEKFKFKIPPLRFTRVYRDCKGECTLTLPMHDQSKCKDFEPSANPIQCRFYDTWLDTCLRDEAK